MPSKEGSVSIIKENGVYGLKISPHPKIDNRSRYSSRCRWLEPAITETMLSTDMKDVKMLAKCVVCIVIMYDKKAPAQTIDPDNIDWKSTLNATKGMFYRDDSIECASLYIARADGDENCTIVNFLPPEKVSITIL